MPFFELKQNVARDICQFLNLSETHLPQIVSEFTSPPKVELGHIAFPCFRLAKQLDRKSNELALEIVSHLKKTGVLASAAGPYVNLRWNIDLLYENTVSEIFEKEERFGSDFVGTDKRVLFEYCSPNIAKKLAFHHIRSTLIGNTLANIYEYLGYQVERINFVGDWGTQFSRLLAAFELWGDREKLSDQHIDTSMSYLLELYIKFHKEIEHNPGHLALASKCLQKMEEGEPHTKQLWERIRDISLASVNHTLKRMNVRFNHVEGESHYIKRISSLLEEIKIKAAARKSEGAWIVDVPECDTPALIQKTDGTTLYLTRDIAAALDRFERFKFENSFYVVATQQKLHFQLLFGVLKKMGFEWSEKCEHLNFGIVLLNSEKMSTREGTAILLDELLDKGKALALEECTKKNPDLANKDQVAEMVGIGAIIFGELSAHRQRDINFDWDHILALDGETGPYVQYSLVRCHSLLKKASEKGQLDNAIEKRLSEDFSMEEEVLILALSKFRSVLHAVCRENEPFHLTKYLIEVSKAFNRFYYKMPVLQTTDKAQRNMRINLVRATKQVLSNGLNLLGIDCPTEM